VFGGDAMSTVTMSLVGDVGRLLAWRSANEDQLDNTCGAYWARATVECLSDRRWPDEEEAALAAASSILVGDPAPERWLPWQGQHGNKPRNHYRLSIPAADEDSAGTSPRGVAAAVRALSESTLDVVALQHDQWTGDVVVALLRSLANLDVPVVAVVNIGTVCLDGSLRTLEEVAGELTHGRRAIDAPADWDVGHFCGVAGVVEGPTGSWVGLVDTYTTIGFNALALQRPEAIAAALHRGGRGTGGVLIVAAPEHRDLVLQHGLIDGIVESMWSNGSTEP
jgi:hypothetical protein